MRRLHRGWLAAPLLLLATGCGTGGTDAATPAEVLTPPPALVVAQDASDPIVANRPDPVRQTGADLLTVLVVGIDGARAPGLDAAITTLLGRPATELVVVASTDRPGAETTMSGFPVRRLQEIDAVLAGTAGVRRPDIVVIGITETSVIGPHGRTTPAAAAARLASAAGIPSLVITTDAREPDFAAAALQLSELFDYQLDRLLIEPSAWALAVPTCPTGLVRGRIEVPVAREPRAVEVDCVTNEPEAPRDDLDAHAQGFVTMTELAAG